MRTIRLLFFLSLIISFIPHAIKSPRQIMFSLYQLNNLPMEIFWCRGEIGDASNLIPLLASDSASHNIAGMVYNGLVKYDKDMNIVGDLAESWEISQNGLVITFHLRKGVKWHDGYPFTSADVLYTYQVTVDPKTPTAYAGDFLKVKKG